MTKEFYTPDEAEAAIKAAAAREAEQTEPGTTADVHYDFSQFGLDRSQSTFAQNLRTSLIVDPPDGKMPPVNAEGQKRARSARRRGRQLGGQYDARAEHADRLALHHHGRRRTADDERRLQRNYQIVQAPGYVMILTEMIHDVRIIPLDGRPQPPQSVRQWTGVSRGRWEGNTLVVETTNFNGKNPFRGASENLKVTERFTRIADDMIDYKFTVEDPSTWDRDRGRAEAPLAKTDGPDLRVRVPRDRTTASPTSSPARAPTRRRPPSRAEEGIELDMRTQACAWSSPCAGLLLAVGAGAGASRVCRGVRRQQAAQARRARSSSGRWSIRTPGSTSP